MILSAIKSHLRAHKRLPLGDLALHFDTDPDAMRAMLDQWIRKGRVERIDINVCCGRSCCGACDAAAVECYQWKGEDQ